jgi:hypothetical protein
MAKPSRYWYYDCGDTCLIPIHRRGGIVCGYALVDTAIKDQFVLRGWTISGANYLSSASKTGHRFRDYMHTIAIGSDAPIGYEIDHVNGDKWDNRRCNLRFVTKSENQRNRVIQRNRNQYGRGVSFDKRRGTFMAYCHYRGKMINLGTFATAADARQAARDGRAKYGYLNVNDWLNAHPAA